MDVRDEVELVDVVMGDMGEVVDGCERVFKVGELVEFWAGPVVRAYRTDSGEPAYVKEIYGLGWYGIKMVGSFGGRNRRVYWNSIFKDGSFQKQVGSGVGPRVRTNVRRREVAKAAAEAQFGDALRATKREILKAGREKEAMKQEAEERLNRQEVLARKNERDLNAGHKRQLDQILDEKREDMQALRDEVEDKARDTRKCVRDLRQDVISLTEQVGRQKDSQAGLEKHLLKEHKKRTVLMKTVVTWKDKHADLDKITIAKEERLMVIRRELAETVREKQTLVKRVERDDFSNRLEIVRLERERNDLDDESAKRNEVVNTLTEQSSQVMKQQQGAIEKEKEREQDADRGRIAARKRFSDKRRSLMRAAITAKEGETKAKAAQHATSLRLEESCVEITRLLAQLSLCDRPVTDMLAAEGRGRPRSVAFERMVRSLLASGSSARSAREHLVQSAREFLRPESADAYASLVPNLRWFQGQREGLGNEAWLYSMLEVSRANECLQHGFDETSIDGTPTLNQWVLLHAGEDLPPRLITIQCAGLLVGSTAFEIAGHIEGAWDIGQQAIGLLREELGGEADNLAPLTNGGVQLHKLRGIMHDTCATANLAAELIGELRNVSGQIQFGYENWENKAKEDKPWYDFLCANHVRNLPIDEFNRLFEEYIKKHLGAELVQISRDGNGRTRVEPSGLLLLRSLCRLTHKGHQQYAKGDGHRFEDWLQSKYNGDIKNRCAGRAEFSKRQDWCVEASWKFHNLIQPINLYCIETLVLDANILRDSILTRVEQIRFQAYVHTCAIMWKVCFQELRALTNTKQLSEAGLNVNPMELNDIYEHVWNLGVLLQTNDCLQILQLIYRPWPKVRVAEVSSVNFYGVLERNRAGDLAELRQYETREDIDNYEPVLKEILNLFGQAIIISLQRTMGKYLQSTGGIYRNELREEWELEKVSQLLSHNNAAERPFGIVKAYLNVYKTMKLSTLANLSLAITNGSHHPAGTIGKTKKTKMRVPKPAGIAVTSPDVLKDAVTKLCGTRVVNTGKVTMLLRAKCASDTLLADERRKARMIADVEKKKSQHLKKGIKFNQNMEEPLAQSRQDLEDELKLLGHAKQTSYAYLKRQFSARQARATCDKFNYPQIGTMFRDKGGKKLKFTPSNGENKLEHIKSLVLLMMQADERRQPSLDIQPTLSGLVRLNPVIHSASTDPVSTRAKAQQDIAIGLRVAQSDDPWLVALHEEYVGKVCYLHDISLRHKLYRICRIAFWPSTKTRYASWEGTMEPIHVHPDGALYRLDDDVVHLSNGKTMTMADKLIGYILAEYIDGDDNEPTRSDCVDRYVFRALEKHNAGLLKLSLAPTRIQPESRLAPTSTLSATRTAQIQK